MPNNSKDTPICKLFTHNGNYYIYDTFSNCIFLITKNHFKELSILCDIGISSYKETGKDTREFNDILLLLKKGLLRQNFIKTIKHYESDYVKYLHDRHVNDLCLQVTRRCNFNCRYCLYTNEHGIERIHENRDMTWETAKKALDYLYNHSCDAESIGISFYGGEPFLNYKLIKKIVDYCNSSYISKSVEYRTTTNGTALNDEIIHFIIKNNFKLAISLDGGKTIQNKHRKLGNTGSDTCDIVLRNINTIRKVSEDYFSKRVSFISVVFDDENGDDVLNFFNNIGVESDRVLLQTASLGGIDYIPTVNYLSKRTPNEGDKLFLNIYANKSEIPENWHHNGPCIPGIKRLFIDTEGLMYPCERIVEHKCLSIGNIYNGVDISKVINFMNIGKLSEQDCKSCWAMRFCDLCIANCNDVNKNCLSTEQKKQACYYVKQRTLKLMRKYIDTHG